MNKSTMIAAIFAASTFSAFAADVYSSNIVGYTKVDVDPGYTISGVQFQSVGGAELDISAIVPTGFESGGALRFWTGTTYQTIGYYPDVYDPADDSLIGPGWGDIDQYIVTRPIGLGEGFWVQSSAAATLTVSGEVGNTNQVAVLAGYTHVVNPSPVVVDIADITATGLEAGGALRFWNGTTYQTIGYYPDVYDPADDSLIGPGWGDIDQYIVHRNIAIGEGFWVQASGAATLTFPDPIP